MAELFEMTDPGAIAGYADVALEQSIDSAAGLTYAVPRQLADLAVGDRVLVPLGRGNKPVTGYVVRLRDSTQQTRIKAILSRDAQAVSLTPDLIELARWMAGYYCSPIGMVFASMLPAAVKHGTGEIMQTLVGLAEEKSAKCEVRSAKDESNPKSAIRHPKLSPLQRTVIATAQALAAQGQPWTPMRDLADEAGARTISPVKQLIEKGVLVTRHESAIRAASLLEEQAKQVPAPPPVTLNAGQKQAVERIAQSVGGGFSVHLIHGVTGSGKTEVYLRVIEHLLNGNGDAKPQAAEHIRNPKSEIRNPKFSPAAIILVPEISLTPQTVARFMLRFSSAGVAVLHSGLTASQRHDQWRRIRHGQARIIVGARSAIFAPVPDIHAGVIIVDEEHESSYKQDQLPRYHARDVAIKRAQLLNIPVLLGSATPSLESYYNAVPDAKPEAAANPKSEIRNPKFYYHHLPDRAPGLTLPTVQLVDLRDERRKRYQMTGSAGVHLLSLKLETELRRAIENGRQAILLLNRRGYANYIACPDHRCGWMMECDHCDATMVYHKDQSLPAGGMVRCHHCLSEQMLPVQCPTCGRRVTVFGLGTQRVEEEIARKIPQARLARMDSDTMRSARDYHTVLDHFRAGEIDVLIGTQMIAKGLDFPNVALVGVISGDTSLNMPDFRASERTFQLIAQVAGRAGRGGETGSALGLVIVQSFAPTDPAIVLASKHDYLGFAQREIALRRDVGLPPITRMARLVIRNEDHLKAMEEARKLADHLAQHNARLDNAVRLRGPMPCPISRIAGFHRLQIELIAPRAGLIQQLLTSLRNAGLVRSDAHTAVDVDPVSLL
ncbi:MAG: primosomal protein N' [Phycisphaeraceae bacterium]